MDVKGVVDRIRQTGLPRLPLCRPEGGLDAPVGLLHVKELLIVLADSADVPLESVARPLGRVLDAMLVDEVLGYMRREAHEFVLVVDEHDTTVGGIALENVVDVIIGEVGHELDAAARDGLRDDDGLAVPGSAFIYAVARELGIDLADVHHATVGGVVVELLGRVPEPGDAVELDGVRLEVTDVQHDRVKEVRIVPAPAGRDAGSS